MGSSFSPEEFRNTALLSVMSQTFVFRHLKPDHPQLADLGRRRVALVLFSEQWFPEVGLADPAKPGAIEFYPIEDLDIAPDPKVKTPFPAAVFDSYKLRVINVALHRAGSSPG